MSDPTPAIAAVLDKERTRLGYLDAIRGIAATFVVWNHYIEGYGLPRRVEWVMSHTPLRIWWDGRAAVSLFFVLSGLVLSRRFFDDHSERPPRPFSYRSYAVQRFFRIWPPYFAVFAISLCLFPLRAVDLVTAPAATPWMMAMWKDYGGPGGLLMQTLLLIPGAKFLVVPQAWTLAVELQLSLLVPLAAMQARRGIWRLAVFTILAIVCGLGRYCFHFALGIILAKYLAQAANRAQVRRPLVDLAVVSLGLLLYTSRFTLPTLYAPLVKLPFWYLTGVGSALILLFATTSPRVQAFLNRKPLAHLGRISYSIYLSHLLILLAFTPRLLNRMTPHGSWTANWWVGFAFTTAAALVLSSVMYRLIEVPSIALGRVVSSRWKPSPSVPLAPATALSSQ